jgi:hypothetical protein
MKRVVHPEISMKASSIRCVIAAALLAGFVGAAHAQTAHPADSASMVRPPGASDASGAPAHNPDNMPIKRPDLPPNANKMLHNSPASDAIAK